MFSDIVRIIENRLDIFDFKLSSLIYGAEGAALADDVRRLDVVEHFYSSKRIFILRKSINVCVGRLIFDNCFLAYDRVSYGSFVSDSIIRYDCLDIDDLIYKIISNDR